MRSLGSAYDTPCWLGGCVKWAARLRWYGLLIMIGGLGCHLVEYCGARGSGHCVSKGIGHGGDSRWEYELWSYWETWGSTCGNICLGAPSEKRWDEMNLHADHALYNQKSPHSLWRWQLDGISALYTGKRCIRLLREGHCMKWHPHVRARKEAQTLKRENARLLFWGVFKDHIGRAA